MDEDVRSLAPAAVDHGAACYEGCVHATSRRGSMECTPHRGLAPARRAGILYGSPMKQATLIFLIRRGSSDFVLLGRKKRGFGGGKYNGFGGKIEPGETARDAAVREVTEESGLVVAPDDLIPAGRVTFFFPARPDFDHDVALFVATRWDGEPRETEEMAPEWFPIRSLPFAMHVAGRRQSGFRSSSPARPSRP